VYEGSANIIPNVRAMGGYRAGVMESIMFAVRRFEILWRPSRPGVCRTLSGRQ
jgi:hypothetical protein